MPNVNTLSPEMATARPDHDESKAGMARAATTDYMVNRQLRLTQTAPPDDIGPANPGR